MVLSPSFVSSFVAVASTTTGGWEWWEEAGYLFLSVENDKISKLGDDPTRYWEDAPSNTPEQDEALKAYFDATKKIITQVFGNNPLNIETACSPRASTVTFIWRV